MIAYTLRTRHGVWIEPLCLHVTPGGQHLYALGLRFGADGLLEHHCFATDDIEPDLVQIGAMPPQEVRDANSEDAVLQWIDRDNHAGESGGYIGDGTPGSRSGDFAVAPYNRPPVPWRSAAKAP